MDEAIREAAVRDVHQQNKAVNNIKELQESQLRAKKIVKRCNNIINVCSHKKHSKSRYSVKNAYSFKKFYLDEIKVTNSAIRSIRKFNTVLGTFTTMDPLLKMKKG